MQGNDKHQILDNDYLWEKEKDIVREVQFSCTGNIFFSS